MDTFFREEAKQIFTQAIALKAEDRPAFVEETCGSGELRAEVDSLLENYDSAAVFFEELGDGIIPTFQEAAPEIDSASDPMVGRQVAHYRIESRLGGGGMGVVYKAENLKLGRHAALKFLTPGLSTDDVARARFAIEAKAASAFDHPNICTIYDIDQTESGQVYIAMAYYDGESLKKRLERGPLDVETALDYAGQVAEGLSRAHGGDIVHRDIKPANIMITREGVVKIVDFGVAKMGDASMTQSGTTLGTMAYMSPEQLEGTIADHRADIWSLGCVLHEMVTGGRAFEGEYPQAVVYSIINGQRKPITDLLPEVPSAVEQIVSKCLRHDLAERYQTTASLYADIYRTRKIVSSARLTPTDDKSRASSVGTEAKRSRVIISFSRGAGNDERLAEMIAEAIGASNEVFLDKMLLVGAKWIERLERELSRADYMVVLLSSESVHSEMVLGQIEMAHRLAEGQDGRPAILPVRVNHDKPLAYPLSHYLANTNFAVWNGESDDDALVEAVSSAIGSGAFDDSTPSIRFASSGDTVEMPLPMASAQPAQLEMPEGTMDPQSRFYIERPEDAVALSAVTRQGVTLTIKGPRQMGKSSLLMRTMAAAARSGKEVVFLDFQLFDKTALRDAETFYRQFCTWITDELDLDDAVEEYWKRPLGHSQRCTRYVGRHLLKQVERPILLAMDEVERVFETEFRSDFFSMLRSWHNDRAIKPRWRNLDLALVTSTEPYQLIENLNQSPFNVGEVVALRDFTSDQVAALNEYHGSPLSDGSMDGFMDLLNGHPYLTRKALFLVASGRLTADELMESASDEHGPFGDHLRYHLFRLHGQSDLIDGLKQVIRDHRCPDESIFWRLRGAGLVRRSNTNVLPRCRLYNDYFKEHLDA
jgi:serine/threonine protein kinase